jgi:hypothetical protein
MTEIGTSEFKSPIPQDKVSSSTPCVIETTPGGLMNPIHTTSSTPAAGVSTSGCRRKLEYDYIWTQIDSLCNTSAHVRFFSVIF